MVVPFHRGITISREVAEQMNSEMNEFCFAVRDISEARERFRHEPPTPEQTLDLHYREIDRQMALLNLAKLVLIHIVDKL